MITFDLLNIKLLIYERCQWDSQVAKQAKENDEINHNNADETIWGSISNNGMLVGT